MKLRNLTALLRIGERILSEERPIAFLGYHCGSFCCYFGWYTKLGGRKARDLQNAGHCKKEVLEHFGITEHQADLLFAEVWYQKHGPGIGPGNYPADHKPNSPEAVKELRKRMGYLRRLIKRASRPLPEHEGGQ